MIGMDPSLVAWMHKAKDSIPKTSPQITATSVMGMPQGHYNQPQAQQDQTVYQQQQQQTVPDQFDAAAEDQGYSDLPGVQWTWKSFPSDGTNPYVGETQPHLHAPPPMPSAIVPLAALWTPFDHQSASSFSPHYTLTIDHPSHLPQCSICSSFLLSDPNGDAICHTCNPQAKIGSSIIEYCIDPPRDQDAPFHVEQLWSNLPSPATFSTLSTAAPLIMLVIDISVSKEELRALQERLREQFALLPKQTFIGLVTFGSFVIAREFGSSDVCCAYAVRNAISEISKTLMLDMLPVRDRLVVPIAKFLESFHDLEPDFHKPEKKKRADRATGTAMLVATDIAEQFSREWGSNIQVEPQSQPLISLGQEEVQTITVSTGPLSPLCFGRLMLFIGGPCTVGPGRNAETDMSITIRSYRDLMEGNAPLTAPALTFYDALRKRLIACSFALDVISQSLDQTTLLEIQPCVDYTGGMLLCGDGFKSEPFVVSLKCHLARCFGLTDDSQVSKEGNASVYDVRIRVQVSNGTRVSGCLGPCSALHTADQKNIPPIASSQSAVGIPGFSVLASTRAPLEWTASVLDPESTFAIVFDTDNGDTFSHRDRFVQFVCAFTTMDGQRRVRVFSAEHAVASLENACQTNAFDQGIAAALIARMAVWQLSRPLKDESLGFVGCEDRSIPSVTKGIAKVTEMVTETVTDVRTGGIETIKGATVSPRHPQTGNFPLKATRAWLDRLLVRFTRTFGSFRPGDPQSLHLAREYSLLPVLLFNLRRSEFMGILNISPDESTFKRHYLMRERVDNCLLMIQPSLEAYSLEDTNPIPVPLDSTSLKEDSALLMDSFFHIHLYLGLMVRQWKELGYGEMPEYSYFRDYLDRLNQDAATIIAQRYPLPRFSISDHVGSADRQLLTHLNPSRGMGEVSSTEGLVLSEDANMRAFMASLKTAVTQIQGDNS